MPYLEKRGKAFNCAVGFLQVDRCEKISIWPLPMMKEILSWNCCVIGTVKILKLNINFVVCFCG